MAAHAAHSWEPAGFTLIETLVALAIIATGVLAMAALALQTTDLVARGRRVAVATFLADAGIAERTGGPIAVTPASCLTSDVAGCVEYRDARGSPVPGPAAAFAIRWHAAPLLAAPVPATVLTVCAVPDRYRAPAARVLGVCASRVVMEPLP